MKFWFTLAIALSSMSSIPAIAQQRQQSAPFTQPQFSQPRPKTPRVAAGCLSPSCWYLCIVTKPIGKPANAPSLAPAVKYDYSDGDFALDKALLIANQVGKSSGDKGTFATTIAYFDSVEEFEKAAATIMTDPSKGYVITGVCLK
jgi:hypothetical protein